MSIDQKDTIGDSKKTGNGALGKTTAVSTGDFVEFIKFCKSKGASAVHIYNSYADGRVGAELFLEVNGDTVKSDYFVNNLGEFLGLLLGFVKKTVNLYRSDLHQAQTAVLKKADSKLDEDLGVALIQQAESEREHLIIFLNRTKENANLPSLGFWGEGYSELMKMVETNQSGVYLIDSNDEFAARNLIGGLLALAKKKRKNTSVVFDDSSWADFAVDNNDRVFTRLADLEVSDGEDSEVSFVHRIIRAEHKIVVFLNGLNGVAAQAAFELAREGKMVFVVTREGSVASGARNLLNLLGRQHKDVSKTDGGYLAHLRFLISISPIRLLDKKIAKPTHKVDQRMVAALQSYFWVESFRQWQRIFKIADPKKEFDTNKLGDFLYRVDSGNDYHAVTNLVEVVKVGEELSRTLSANPHITADTISYLIKGHLGSDFISKKEDGLIKALRGEVDIVDVIKTLG